jgi:N-alpha-acetyltransferase 15/16, NatA auxiliary subunit
MAPTSTKRTLASKENNLFKELLALYEARQLKKGIKTADAILKKNPDHGGMWRPYFSWGATSEAFSETLCMKGLLLTHMGRREEGLELVKKGIRLDITSHIVWHVYGLIQKGQKDYEGALKSYTQALRCDKVRAHIFISDL